MDFTQVITRLPSLNCANGETTATAGEPDSLQTRQQFFRYIEILLELNLRVTILPAEPEFPDAHFVEDPAVVIPELAIITHPGAKSRQGKRFPWPQNWRSIGRSIGCRAAATSTVVMCCWQDVSFLSV